MKTKKRLAAAVLLICMLLATFGSGFTGASASRTVTTDSELAYDPLARSASIAYEKHDEGYTVRLDRAADSVTMYVSSVPGDESSRSPEKAQLYVHTGVELRPGAAYRVSFSLRAERAQPEYAVSFDGASAAGAYGRLDGRSIEAGATDKVSWQVTPQAAGGELVLRLMLGKTGASGNTLRLSDLAVEEAPANQTGENVVLVDSLDYNTPGFIRLSTNADSGASITCDGESATLTVTKEPAQGAEVWKIKMLVATGLKPQAGKIYRFTADVDSTAKRDFELCYNEDDAEKGFGAEYSQRLTGPGQKLEYMISIPKDKASPGELILQFSLGMMKAGEKFTIRNIMIEEAVPTYKNIMSDYSFDTSGVKTASSGTYTKDRGSKDVTEPINWDTKAIVSASGEFIAGDPTISVDDDGIATMKLRIRSGSRDPWHALFNIDTGEELKAGKTYRASFYIETVMAYSNYEVLYGTGLNGVDNNQAYGARKGLKLKADTREESSFIFTPEADGGLVISLQVGQTELADPDDPEAGGKPNVVTVSDVRIEEMVPGMPSDESVADVNYPSEDGSEPSPSVDPGSFRARGGNGTLTGDGQSATLIIANTGETWERGLYIDDICDLSEGSKYEVSFDIKTDGSTFNYHVFYNKDEDFGPDHEGAFGSERDISVSSEWSTHKYTIDAQASGKLRLWIELGAAEADTQVTVRNIDVEPLDGGSQGPSIGSGSGSGGDIADVGYPTLEPGSFEARDKKGAVTGDGESATIICPKPEDEPAAWQRGLFTGKVAELEAGKNYKVSFDIRATNETNYDVVYNKDGDWGESEKGFGDQYGQTATPEWSTCMYTVEDKGSGALSMRIDLGLAPEGTEVTVRNIKVEPVDGGSDIASVNYPDGGLGSFEARDKIGAVTGDGESATMTCAAPGGGAWERGLFTGKIAGLEEGKTYLVSFKIKADKETPFEVCYNKDGDWGDGHEKGFGGEYELTATATEQTVEHEVTADGNNALSLRIDLGFAPDGARVTVSDIKVAEGGSASSGGSLKVSVKYPSVSSGSGSGANPGSFSARDGNGTISGDGSSATITCAAQEANPEAWQRGLFTGTIAALEAGKSYLVSFKIKADKEAPFEVCYNKDGDWGASEKGFGGKYGMTAKAAEQTVEYTVNADGNNALSLRIDLGLAPEGTNVTVSDIQVREIGYAPVGTPKQVNKFGSVWAEADAGKGYTAELTKNSDSAVLKVTKPAGAESANYFAKLFIRTGLNYGARKAYRAKFDITATNAQNEFCVISRGVSDDEDIRGTWALSIGAGETKTITTRAVPAGLGSGDYILQLELGNLDGNENTFTISNIRVEEVDLDVSYDYITDLATNQKAATLRITESPEVTSRMEPWMVKEFLPMNIFAAKGDSFRVAFDVRASNDMDFEVSYNRGRVDGEKIEYNEDGDEITGESAYGAETGLHVPAGSPGRTIEHFFTASKDGWLNEIQLNLGLVEAPNTVTVRNLRVDEVVYAYSGKSALPAEINYSTPSAVSYWSHEDYTTTFTGSDSAITANIKQAPESGAEPWKIKLFLDTGTPLQAGKYYKVTANVVADASQDFEITYNNGGVEFGYDSLGGLHLAGGVAQTVEKVISVPADKADRDNLTLQFNLGKTNSANRVTVSGVKVEEVPLSYADMMAKDFTYTGSGTGIWTNPDYTATLDASSDSATIHITGVPSSGAEVWKAKLFVNTGAMLSAGKTYLVRADMHAAKAQNYEVCFNNEETEKGFDALYGQHIAASSTATIEKTISVPASMTDAGELVLQFSVGDAVANDITVSNVSVQELDFGSGGGAAPDTVVKLYNAPQTAAGTLDVTRERLTYRISKISSEPGDNAVAIAGADLRANDLYTVTFTAKADRAMTGTFALGRAGGAEAISEQFRLTTAAQTYSFTTPYVLSEGGAYDLTWKFGSADNQKLGSANVEISNISVSCPAEKLEIMRSTQNVTVNGRKVEPDVYSINGYNYFKLRDLAVLLNDTDGQFVVRYNEKNNMISLTTDKAYTPVGGELEIGENRAESCARSSQDITVNGRTVNLKAYNIGGNNFFRLRDLSELLGFTVEYIAESDTAAITSPLTPEAQEKAHDYDIFFLPEVDGETQPYVGDTMPFYEDGVYYIYYLKDGGDSYNHSVYLATTTDFVKYTEYDDPVLSASREDVQDNWIGTGSVVKIDGTYYFFYTGFNASGSQEYHEKIMVAAGSSPTSFEKVTGWEIVPPDELGQKNDFRDPQAYYDPASRTISLTVTASQGGAARILKYSLDKDLKSVRYDGIIYTDPTGAFWNLECSDTFRIGDKWYLTYSGQDDTLWYAMSDSRFGPYRNSARLEGKLFYAAKHVEDGTDSYMVGWARRANSASSTEEVSGWAGNIAVQKLHQNSDGTLSLVPVDSITASFDTQRDTALGASGTTLTAGSGYSYKEAFTTYESFMITGEFTYSGTGSFGLAFDFNGNEEQYKFVSVDPAANRLSLALNEGKTLITEMQAPLTANQKHSFTYIQDGSIGIFYLDDQAALLVRVYGATDKPIYLFAENNSVTFTSLQQFTQ